MLNKGNEMNNIRWPVSPGPDICGYSTKKVHVIFNYKGQNHLIKKDIKCKVANAWMTVEYFRFLTYVGMNLKILAHSKFPPSPLFRMMSWPTYTRWSWIQTRHTRWRSTMRRWSPVPWRMTGTCFPQRRSRIPRLRNPATGTTGPRSTTPMTLSLR